MKKCLIFSLIFIGNLCFGIDYSFQRDVLDEIKQSDFLNLSDETKTDWVEKLSQPDVALEEVRAIVNRALHTQDANQDSVKQAFVIEVPDRGSSRQPLLEIRGEKLSLKSRHAIQDLEVYIQNRVGKAFFEATQERKFQTLVLGSTPQVLIKDLQKILAPGSYSVTSIPSVYEKWGLFRYWVQSHHSRKSYVVLVVPPSTQYVRHYTTLLNSLSVSARSTGYLNESEKKKFNVELQRLAKKLGEQHGSVSVLFFGYQRNWLRQLNRAESPWSLTALNEIRTELSLNLQLMELTHKRTGQVIRVGALQPDQTVWGELASDYFKAFLQMNPKVVIFMGSAGALRADLKPYQISIPRAFHLQSNKVRLENWFLSNSSEAMTPEIFTSSRHGITYSPIQQTQKYVKSLVDHRIDTIDVEQALVARMVYEHNIATGSSIQFGALNVITDIPGRLLKSGSQDIQFDLDVLNKDAKDSAKDQAALIALHALDSWSSRVSRPSCRSLLRVPR